MQRIEDAKALRNEISRLEEQLELQSRQAHELHDRLGVVLRSRSWRLTRPFRATNRIIRGDRSLLYPLFRTLRTRFASVARPTALRLSRLLEATELGANRFRDLRVVRRRRASDGPLYTQGNLLALQDIVDQRSIFSMAADSDPLCATPPAEWPDIDLSVVTHNSAKWLDRFMTSLNSQSFPIGKIALFFFDSGSAEGTIDALDALKGQYAPNFRSFEIIRGSNRGYGSGNNIAISRGRAPYCLISNPDIEFETDSISRAISVAVADAPNVACWELRQRPYEHPKYYDPVTGLTNWCSHACVIIRRSAFDDVGGYDHRIFLYGEDVELSYRLRRAGYRLRYLPCAAVTHHTYETPNELKPIQHRSALFASLYLRLKYGSIGDIRNGFELVKSAMRQEEAYEGARRDLSQEKARAIKAIPAALAQRRRSAAHFPFHGWDYEVAREGAFVGSGATKASAVRISIITRTVAGREAFLSQALLSVAHQTYGSIEHIVVEDGSNSQQKTVERIAQITGRSVYYVSLEKYGRSRAGNHGLSLATGEYVGFLDDDDLLLGDHCELLVQALQNDSVAHAAYSLAWEIRTVQSGPSGTYAEQMPVVPPLHRQSFSAERLMNHNYIPIQAALFRRRLYLERGGFDPTLEHLEDWNLWNRYAAGGHFVHVPKVTSIYRIPAAESVAAARQTELDRAYQAAAALNRIHVAQFGGRARACMDRERAKERLAPFLQKR